MCVFVCVCVCVCVCARVEATACDVSIVYATLFLCVGG